MKALLVALFVSGLFAANLDISDSIAPSQDNANPSANQGANQANQATNQSANQPQNNANPPANQGANPNSANQANQNANAVNPNPNNANPNANNANQVANQSPNQANQPTPPQAQTPKAQKEQKPRPSDPDERLKEDIVSFEREKHIQDSANIDDPFIYVYQQTEDELARRTQLEQAVLTLKSIIIAPDSNNNRIKRYKAHINNQWVEECKVVGKSRQCDSIEGWEVARITEDGVKLRVTRYNMKRDLQLMSKKVTIKKEDYK